MELEIDELLGREKVEPNKFLLQRNIKDDCNGNRRRWLNWKSIM